MHQGRMHNRRCDCNDGSQTAESLATTIQGGVTKTKAPYIGGVFCESVQRLGAVIHRRAQIHSLQK
jgi:hypothetical protein